MATMSDIVERAFRKVGIVAKDEDMDADQAADGIVQLNSLMFGWKLAGVNFTHTEKALGDTFPLGPEFEEATVWQLAERLGPDYGVAAPSADMWLRMMQAELVDVTPMTLETTLTTTPSQRRWIGY